MARRSPALVPIVAMLLTLLLVAPSAAATDTICGRVDAVAAASATVDGVEVGIADLGTDAVAGLQLALNAGTSACVTVTVEDGQPPNATAVDVSLSRLCGNIDPAPGSDVMVDRVLIPPDLLRADVLAALQWSINQDASACFSADVSGGGAQTTVDVTLDLSVCSPVTAVGDGSVTLSGMQFAVAPEVDLQASVGEALCVVIGTADDGSLQVIAVDDEDDGSPGPTPGGGQTPPDTAIASPTPIQPFLELGVLLVATAALGAGARRRRPTVSDIVPSE